MIWFKSEYEGVHSPEFIAWGLLGFGWFIIAAQLYALIFA